MLSKGAGGEQRCPSRRSPRMVQLLGLPATIINNECTVIFFGFLDRRLHSSPIDENEQFYYYYGLDFSIHRDHSKIEMHRIHLQHKSRHLYDECLMVRRPSEYSNDVVKNPPTCSPASHSKCPGAGSVRNLPFLDLRQMADNSATPSPSGKYLYTLRANGNGQLDDKEAMPMTLVGLYRIDTCTLAVDEIDFDAPITLSRAILAQCYWTHLHFVSDEYCFLKIMHRSEKEVYRRVGPERFDRQVLNTTIYSLEMKNGHMLWAANLLEFLEPPSRYLDDFSKFNEDCRVLLLNKQINVFILKMNEGGMGGEQLLRSFFYFVDFCTRLFVFDDGQHEWIEYKIDGARNEMQIDENVGKNYYRSDLDNGCLIKDGSGYYFRMVIDFVQKSYFYVKLFCASRNIIPDSTGTNFVVFHWSCFEFLYWDIPPTLSCLCYWAALENIIPEAAAATTSITIDDAPTTNENNDTKLGRKQPAGPILREQRINGTFSEECAQLLRKYPNEKCLLIPMNGGFLREIVGTEQIIRLRRFISKNIV